VLLYCPAAMRPGLPRLEVRKNAVTIGAYPDTGTWSHCFAGYLVVSVLIQPAVLLRNAAILLGGPRKLAIAIDQHRKPLPSCALLQRHKATHGGTTYCLRLESTTTSRAWDDSEFTSMQPSHLVIAQLWLASHLQELPSLA
jgi:hypothetical protein